jgi:hypothetical protein
MKKASAECRTEFFRLTLRNLIPRILADILGSLRNCYYRQPHAFFLLAPCYAILHARLEVSAYRRKSPTVPPDRTTPFYENQSCRSTRRKLARRALDEF